METERSKDIKEAVRELYAALAKQQASSCCGASQSESSSCSCGCSGIESRAQVLY
jgi:hypothetical protein